VALRTINLLGMAPARLVSKRNEVRSMTYTKPQLLGYSAIAAIQSGGIDKQADQNEHQNMFPSDPAYQADE